LIQITLPRLPPHSWMTSCRGSLRHRGSRPVTGWSLLTARACRCCFSMLRGMRYWPRRLPPGGRLPGCQSAAWRSDAWRCLSR